MRLTRLNLLIAFFALHMASGAQVLIPATARMSTSSIIQKTTVESSEGKVIYSYSSPTEGITKDNGVGIQSTQTLKLNAAIRFSEGMISLLKGRKLFKIRIGVASPTEDATVFIQDASGKIIWSKATALLAGWNEIAMEDPFVIPSAQELYIGYSVNQRNNVFVIAVGNSANKKNGLFFSMDDDVWQEYTTMGNLCLAVEVEGTVSEFNYLGSPTEVFAVDPYLPAGKSTEIVLGVFNEGEKKISQVTLARTFNDQALSDTVCFFKRSIPANSTGSLSIAVTPSENGKYGFSIKQIEEAEVNTSFRNARISLYNEKDAFERMVVIEEFTSQYCGNCPSAQSYLRNLTAGYEDKMALILHHSGFKEDAFTVYESLVYTYFFNSNQTYAPAMMMDRTYISDYVSGALTPIYMPQSLQKDRFLAQINTPAVASLNIESQYDEATRNLKVVVNGKMIAEPTDDRIGLNVFLLESKYQAMQYNANDAFEHNHFLRKALSGVMGDKIVFNESGEFTKEYNYTIPQTYYSYGAKYATAANPDNMNLVAFIGNFDATNPINCKILNACKTTTLNQSVEMSRDQNKLSAIKIIVEEGCILIEGEYQDYQVYDMYGQMVDPGKVGDGIYIVKVNIDVNKTEIRKVLVR